MTLLSGARNLHFATAPSRLFIMQVGPISSTPNFRSFAPNVLPWMPQNVTVVLVVGSVILRNKFKGAQLCKSQRKPPASSAEQFCGTAGYSNAPFTVFPFAALQWKTEQFLSSFYNGDFFFFYNLHLASCYTPHLPIVPPHKLTGLVS